MWSSNYKALKWAMSHHKNEWVLTTWSSGIVVGPEMTLWRAVPDWIYTRDGMGYKKNKKVASQ